MSNQITPNEMLVECRVKAEKLRNFILELHGGKLAAAALAHLKDVKKEAAGYFTSPGPYGTNYDKFDEEMVRIAMNRVTADIIKELTS